MTTKKHNTNPAGEARTVLSPPRSLAHGHGASVPGTNIDVVFCDEELARVPLRLLVDAARGCGGDAPVLVLAGYELGPEGHCITVAGDLGKHADAAPMVMNGDDEERDDAHDEHDHDVAELWFGQVNGQPTFSSAPRVLIADDDDDLRRLIAQAFADIGFDVVEAADGDVAIAVARHIMEHRPGGARLDLVVSDLGMPGRDGMSVLAALRGLEGEVPVIVMSASSGVELQRCEDAGAFAVLEKPFDLDELCALAREVASWRHV